METGKQILQTYEERWPDLWWDKQRHFAYRAWLVTKDKIWWSRFKSTLKQTKKSIMILNRLNDQERRGYGSKRPVKVFPDKSNGWDRFEVRQKYPEVKFWGDYLENLRYLSWSGVKTDWKMLDKDRLISLIRLMRKEDLIRLDPAWVVERIYDLRRFGGVDLDEGLYNWLTKYLQVGGQMKQKIKRGYFLTHVVIGESDYYLDRVDKDQWAVEELVNDFEEMMRLQVVDLMAETGVCYKIAGVEDQVDYHSLKRELRKNLNLTAGRLVRDEGDINTEEHRNIMVAMALMGWK